MRRKVYDELIKWKKESNGKVALLIDGARRIGKSYIAEQFAKENYKSYILIDFNKVGKDVKELFDNYLDNLDMFFMYLSSYYKTDLYERDTLIIFDEVQLYPRARSAIKYLVADGRYDYIETGSLISIKKNVEDILIPSEERHLNMYPMDFEEFLWAEGYENGISYLRELFDNKEKVPFALNEKYETLFREYMVVGGMPEVVADYVENHDFTKVAAIQEKILENYRFDISKHAKGAEKIKVRRCYEAIPRQLAKEITKFQYSTVEKGQTSKKYGGSIQWLKDSNIVNPCYNIHEPYLPLMANADENQFKLYINDTGLLCAMYGFETKKAVLENVIKGNAKGGIYENIIAEILVKNGYELYYYRPDDSNELEFLIEKNGEVIPVEVKAGNTATKSLNRFIEKYKPTVAYKIVDGNVGVNENKLTIPHYMVMFL